MPNARGLCLPIAMLLLVSCVFDSISGPPRGFPHAAATNDCGPTDGEAVSIFLTAAPMQSLNPSAPYLRATVLQSVNAVSGRSWSVGWGSAEGYATFYSAATVFQFATSGTVTVTSVSANSVEGTADVSFPNADRIRGSFKATWIPNSGLCG